MSDRFSPRTAQKKTDVAVLMTDRLALGSLGAYGNGGAETPAFDRLAAESVLFDRFYTVSPTLEAAYRSFWTGDSGELSESLAQKAAEAGYLTILATDESALLDLEQAGSFKRVLSLEAPKPSGPVETIEETALYRFFAQTAETLTNARREGRPLFFWGHSVGFAGVWDFPLSLRALFREDEEDPAPYAGLNPPFAELFGRIKRKKRLAAADASSDIPDFDRLCEIAESYAAGCSVWDQGLEAFLGLLSAERFFDSGFLALGSTGGFPLGEHGRIGFAHDGAPLFYAEELHRPLLVRFPGPSDAAPRIDALVTETDLYRTLAALFAGEECDQALGDLACGRLETIRPFLRQTLALGEGSVRGLTTPNWFLRVETAPGGGESTELYVRPDDRFDVNEVSTRCAETVEELKKLLNDGE